MSDQDDFPERNIQDLTVRIDRMQCIGAGDCIKVAPEVFEFDDQHIVKFRQDLEPVERERLIEACKVCPVEALFVMDEEGKQIVPEE